MAMRTKPIYLDYQASTPVDPRVFTAMAPYFADEYGNPHSASHAYGQRASAAIRTARRAVGDLLSCPAEDIVFTSGATEANNLALFGAYHASSPIRRFIAPATEHPSVLEPLARLRTLGADTIILPVMADGLIDLCELEHQLVRGPALVSVMAANNEIGVVQPIAEIGALCHRYGAWLHTDATQLIGKGPLDLARLPIDLLTLSSHKIYGPKGIGALVARHEVRSVLAPLTLGGGQEGGLRAGTLPTPLVVGLGEACRLAEAALVEEPGRLAALRNLFLAQLESLQVRAGVNGSMKSRLPNNLSLRIEGVDSLALFALAPDLAISSGSACASGTANVTPSHVLKALGLSDDAVRSSVRISVGRFTTEDEVCEAAELLAIAIAKLRRIEAMARAL